MINSTERSDILVFNCYLCHVSCFACFLFNSTKLGEISDISKCFDDFVAQARGFLIRFCSAELRYSICITRIMLFERFCTVVNDRYTGNGLRAKGT